MRPSRAAFLAALLAAGGFWWWRKPPKGVERLDSGSDNGAFEVGDDGRLYYATRGAYQDIAHSIDLATGRRVSRRLWGRRIVAFGTYGAAGRVKMVVDNGKKAPSEARYSYLSLNGDDLSTRLEQARPSDDQEGLALFDTPFSTGAAISPKADKLFGAGVRMAPGGLDVSVARDGRVGPPKRYATPGAPVDYVWTSSGAIVVAYRTGSDASRLETIRPFEGRRSRLADLSGVVESIGIAGEGIVAVRAVTGGTRLSFVSVSDGKERLDAAWSKGGSRILSVDPVRRRLYFQTSVKDSDGSSQDSAWSVPMDRASLESAAKFFSTAHDWPELRWKLMGHAVETAIVLVVLGAAGFFVWTFRDMFG